MSEVLLTSSDTEEEDADEEYEEEASEEIPASLLSYFEASRRRAAACEKLILEDLEYLTASQCNERPAQANFVMVDKDTKTTNETADTSDEQNEDTSASSGSYADEQEFSTVPCYRHDVGVSELQLDMERRRREEQEFEKELQRMMAAGKLRQKKADMTEVKAREELEREFRLQQELLNDMKRQVEEEVKKRDEEQRRLARRQKEEEEKRKRGQDEDRWKMVQGKLKEEEEKNEKSKEANRKQRVEEEERRKKEEEVNRRKETQSKLKEEVEMTRSSQEDDKRRKHVEEEQEMNVKRGEVEARRKQTEEEEKRRTNGDDEGHKQLQEEPTVNKEEEERWKKAERKLKEEKEMEEDKRKQADRRGKVEKEVEKRRKEVEEAIANWGEEGEKRKQEAEVMQMQEEVMGKKEDGKGTSKKAVSKRQEEEGKLRRFVEKEESRREETKGRAIEDDEKKKRGEPMKESSQNTEEKEKRNKEAVRKKEEKAKERKEEEGKKRSEQMEEEASSKMKDVEVEMRRKQEEMEKKIAEEVKKDLGQECEKKGERRRIEEEEESDRMGRGEERMDKMEGAATDCEERRKKIEEVDVKMKREEAEMSSPESAEGEKRGKELEMKTEEEENRMERQEKSSIEAETQWKEDKETRTREEEGSMTANEEDDQWRWQKENQRTEEVEKRKKNEEGERSEELQPKCPEEEERRKSDDTGMRKVKENTEVKERRGEDEKLLEEEKSEQQWMNQKDEKMTGRREEEERRNTKKSDESTDQEDENEEPLTKNQHQRDASNPNIHQNITENLHEDIHHNSSCRSCLSRLMDQRRLSWMEVRVPWSEMENRSRRTSSLASRRESRRSGQDNDLPPLCPNALLRDAGRGSLQEVTILVLEDLPGCSLSTLAQCTRLQSLTMRRCGLKVLEGIRRLADLCYVDVPENQISRLDCEDMTGLRVLKMSCNKLTSIHGLSGAENLHILELSHNSIARIAGLDSLRKLQRLSLDHNQLVSTKGLKDVCTLLHLDCSYNHLATVEGLESNVLLRTLDLTSNSLSEPPVLQDHVLLGELHLDDNSLASLRHLFSASWLPQLHTLTLAHNRLTHLPDMSVAVSLANLDLRFNCLSDVQDVCRSLEGCCSLDEVHLAGNPLQRESGWRCTLQAEVSSLRTIDGTDTDILRTRSAVARQIDSGSGVLSLIRTQLHQMNDLQRQHTEQLSKVSRPLDAIKLSCGHLMEALHLAKEQRRSLERAHVGPTSASWTTLQDSLDEVSPAASGTGCATPFCDVHTSAVEGTRSSVQMVSHHQDWDPQSNSVASEVGGGYASYEGNPESAVQKSIIAQHHAATLIQARWRGFTLRRRLAAALAAVTSLEDDDDAFELVDVEEFVMDETTLEQGWTLCEDAPARCYSASKQPLPGIYPEHFQLVLPPLPKQRLTQAWEVKECEEKRVSPQSSNRKMSSSTSMASDFSERSERILEEWGFTNRHTAELMLRRAQKMKSKQKSAGPSGQLEAWRNQPLTTYQLQPPNRLARHNRNATRVHQAETGPGRARWDRTREWLRNQNTLRHSESEHFLPNISADLVNGRRRRLLAPEAGRMENQATGVWACNNLLAQDCRENKNTVGLPVESGTPSPPPPCQSKSPKDLNVFLVQDIQVEQDIPTAWRKERISFRDEPVCRSSGWGGGKKRQKVKH
ncbi:leucine-rich repeat and IQ domain-containing protein 1 [Hippocampus comes]|uniref:leucine-rich repeat and IQ domain-containing protein 1 n=1 Tax=Hippocampus comes TaxID=109280 RepID=UPI00094ED6EA|nr:PREDICTED: leucine-rich repeat and IQ domain-containing protein 1 [Hippocampus comes]